MIDPVSRAKTRVSIVMELMSFLWLHRQWWLIPMVAALVILGLLLSLAQSSALGPFMYTIF